VGILDQIRRCPDEIRHARICFALHGGHEGPGPLVTPPGVGSLAELVRETIREGCVNETLAALEARAMAGKMPPHLREVLNAIADDEERHAELAWRILAWTVARGGEGVRRAIDGALSRVAFHAGDHDLPGHGLLGRSAQEAVLAHAMREVIAPCLSALLGASGVA
jgi:hypothetical protein